MLPTPTVSIVVPCRNEARIIRQSLASMCALQPPPGGFEIIVADGMSDDGTTEILNELASAAPDLLRVIPNPGQMVSPGLNRAIRAARGRLIVRMDAHTKYSPDYLIACVAAKARTGADNVGGPWRAVGTGVVGEAIAASFHSPLSTGGGGSHDLGHEGLVDTVYLGCWDRALFDRMGGFDEQLVRNQDDEFNLRIVRGGGRVWQSPAIRSEYECRSSLRKLARQFYQYGYWKVRVIQKHAIPASWRHLAPAIALSFIAALTLAAFVSASAALPAGLAWIGYTAVVSAEALRLAASRGWRLLPAIIATFPCYHFGYGIGFLHGLLDFVVLHRDGRASALELSR